MASVVSSAHTARRSLIRVARRLRTMTRGYKRICWILISLAGIWVVYTALQGPFALKRSIPGRVVRFVLGSPGAMQDVDDLADELSLPSTAAALRLWAESVLDAQRTRHIPAEAVQSWPIACAPSPDIAPAPVLAQHRAVLWCTPETYLHVDAQRSVAAVVLSWAHLRVGLVVRPGGDAPPLNGTFYERQPSPDIRVFSINP